MPEIEFLKTQKLNIFFCLSDPFTVAVLSRGALKAIYHYGHFARADEANIFKHAL